MENQYCLPYLININHPIKIVKRPKIISQVSGGTMFWKMLHPNMLPLSAVHCFLPLPFFLSSSFLPSLPHPFLFISLPPVP